MNVARLNFSHGEHATHAQNISWIRELSEEKKQPIAILQDLQGPKIRTGKLKNGGIVLEKGQKVNLAYGLEQTSDDFIPVDYRDLSQDTHIGARILMDDGLMGMRVLGIEDKMIKCEVLYGGTLKSRKGVNFPDDPLSIPSTTEKDTRDLMFGVSQGVDFVALSFVRQKEDVLKLKSMLRALGADTPVISKIEMLSAVQNIDEICEVSDGIMVARGDLGVECGFSNVAAFQKRILISARKFGKPAIVATQMLDSMIENKRPTKAEITDVANAVFDLADATMLSGESASGKHPAHVVKTMKAILESVDTSSFLQISEIQFKKSLQEEHQKNGLTSPELFSQTISSIVKKSNVKAIVCLTLSGNMAREIAKHRPSCPIIAVSPRPDVVRRMSLVKGVIGVKNNLFLDTDSALSHTAQIAIENNMAQKGDLILITAGIPLVGMKPTNMIKLQRL
jgi:pyruvate kinase